MLQVLSKKTKQGLTHDARLLSESRSTKRGVSLTPEWHLAGCWVPIVSEELVLPPASATPAAAPAPAAALAPAAPPAEEVERRPKRARISPKPYAFNQLGGANSS